MTDGTLEVIFVGQDQIDLRINAVSEGSAESTSIALTPDVAARVGRALILAAGSTLNEDGGLPPGTVIGDGMMFVEGAEANDDPQTDGIQVVLSVAEGLSLPFLFDPLIANEIAASLQTILGKADWGPTPRSTH